MQKDPFIVLGLDKNNANQQDVRDSYERLKTKYSQERFLEGDAGRHAAVKLDELETAYRDAMNALAEQSTISSFGSVYGEVEKLLKEGNLSEAQAKLDMITSRDAEWHYLQSAIYYKRDWKNDSKKQLEIAISLAPDNAKYKTALEKLNIVMNGAQRQNNSYDGSGNAYNGAPHGGSYQRSYGADPYYERRRTSMDCCQSLICADCCCECMGGDLIRCC